jgi:transmembrane sensor
MIYDNAGMQITLKANESAHYVIATGELELEVQTYAPATGEKTFLFDNQRLEDVVNRLKTVYNADIRIEEEQVKNCRITTQFKDEDLEIVLSIVTETLGLTLQKQGTSYLIKGQSCID